MFGESSLFSVVKTASGATILTVTMILLTTIVIMSTMLNLGVIQMFHKFIGFIVRLTSKMISKKEITYHRDLEIGRISEKKKKVKFYRLLSDLIIDLGWKDTGLKPYELLTFVIVGSVFVVTIICMLLFGSPVMSIFISPIAIVAVICVMYTRANIAHDARIEAVIEAENVVCNNIKNGVVVAVRESLNVMPKQVRGDFRDFVDHVTQENYHIKTALLELNQKLGGISDDFIKKCIVFELEEQHGIVGMFSDVVEVNNIRMEMRIYMKKKFEEVMYQFKIGAMMIFGFLGGLLCIYPFVRNLYFATAVGQILLCIDLLLLIIEFVYITYLRAQEL